MSAFRVLRQSSALKIAVEVGLVVGTICHGVGRDCVGRDGDVLWVQPLSGREHVLEGWDRALKGAFVMVASPCEPAQNPPSRPHSFHWSATADCGATVQGRAHTHPGHHAHGLCDLGHARSGVPLQGSKYGRGAPGGSEEAEGCASTSQATLYRPTFELTIYRSPVEVPICSFLPFCFLCSPTKGPSRHPGRQASYVQLARTGPRAFPAPPAPPSQPHTGAGLLPSHSPHPQPRPCIKHPPRGF